MTQQQDNQPLRETLTKAEAAAILKKAISPPINPRRILTVHLLDIIERIGKANIIDREE